MLSTRDLISAVEEGTIDTVVVAFTDMQGRLLGKRLRGDFFVEHVLGGRPIEGCNYLLATEMEMDPVPGYQLMSWERGYGDFAIVPDLSTLRRTPWLEGSALLLSDVVWHDGSPVTPSPRQVLKRQTERAGEQGYTAMFASELEFYLLKQSYAEAHESRYRELTPSVAYNLDYHILGATYDEPLLRRIRNDMAAAGVPIENSKGEAWPGQHEVNFRYDEAVVTADNHVVFKNGAKEMAHLHGRSLTFMAKPDHGWIGSSGHIHVSLWKGEKPCFAGESDVFRQFLAGLIAFAKELSLFLAPSINSYKRFTPGSWAPTSLAWAHDNRTVGFRVVGHGDSIRIENRIPGADVNPYLAFAAMLAAGLHGIRHELEPPPPLEGNAYESGAERFPHTLRDAIAALEGSAMAREAFGDDVVDHYLNYARTEQRLFDEVVTGYERERYFERG